MVFTVIMPRERTSSRHERKQPPPSPGRLASLLEEAGVPLDEKGIRLLWRFHTLLRARNRELNMTRIHNFENMVLKHYVDCLMVPRLVDLPSPLVDIGTGAGFPGIPIKIARPAIRLVLAEGRGKRAAFLEEAVALLGLDGAGVYGHKVGRRHDPRRDLGIVPGAVITRALEEIPATLERVFPLLDRGGLAIFMKGPDCDEEMKAAGESAGGAFRLAEDIRYTLAGSPHLRRLVVFEKTGAKALPGRRNGKSPRGLPPDRPAERGPAFPVREITSASNPTWRTLRSLLTSRGIRRVRRAIVAGIRPVAEILEDRPDLCRGWITPLPREERGSRGAGPGAPPPREAPSHITWYRLSPGLFKELDRSGTKAPLLLVDLPAIPLFEDRNWPPGCTLFVPFQDPENVGAVIRSAAAFGAARVVLLAEAAHPFLPKSQRAAGSAIFRVPLLEGPSIQDLDLSGAPLVALSLEGEDIAEETFPPRFGLLAGLEGPGLPEKFRKERTVRIPMEPGTESLNAGAAVAVALFAWRLQKGKERSK